MRAGNLNDRVTFQRRTLTDGRANVPQETWADAFTVWAEVQDVSARERVAAPGIMPVRTATFRIRWRADVEETMRILHDAISWQITGIKRLGRREALEIAAEHIEV